MAQYVPLWRKSKSLRVGPPEVVARISCGVGTHRRLVDAWICEGEQTGKLS